MRLYSPEFAADPRRFLTESRHRHGPVVPIELAPGVPAALVLSYRDASPTPADDSTNSPGSSNPVDG
ncbi:hypothetical protein [Nocardia sp. JMUB6875]|uniref:hypothetical protein n=1 Tax=Nocardia sp. JMUB6875 TaxID=3158170 RepID=UPI0034E86900